MGGAVDLIRYWALWKKDSGMGSLGGGQHQQDTTHTSIGSTKTCSVPVTRWGSAFREVGVCGLGRKRMDHSRMGNGVFENHFWVWDLIRVLVKVGNEPSLFSKMKGYNFMFPALRFSASLILGHAVKAISNFQRINILRLWTAIKPSQENVRKGGKRDHWNNDAF